MNDWHFTGRVIKEPDVRINPTKTKSVAHFTVAVKRNRSKECDYFTLTAFDNTALFVDKYIKKGSELTVKAYIINNNYEKDGKKYYDYDFIVTEIELHSSDRKNNKHS
jgi:single-stranded DNA-binding protein